MSATTRRVTTIRVRVDADPDKPTKQNWTLFYSRGVCNERLKDWPAAEADFKQGPRLHPPDELLVLNYLGYSWVDQGLNLKQAMDYIRKAVKLKPDDGYYVDSLGWAYYRLGNMPEAVENLERAVELRPDDPIINDHLGRCLLARGAHSSRPSISGSRPCRSSPMTSYVATIEQEDRLWTGGRQPRPRRRPARPRLPAGAGLKQKTSQ